MSDLQQFILNKLEKMDEKVDDIREYNASMKAAFEAHQTRDEEIHSHVVALGSSIDKHSVLLQEYNQQLEIHIKATRLLESAISPIIQERSEIEIIRSARRRKITQLGVWFAWLAGLGTAIVAIIDVLSRIL